MSTGFLAYEGLSGINNEPVLGIVTFGSKNAKTGFMNSLWILPRNEDPWEAVKNGRDESVCGDCALRSNNGCYVQVPKAPLSIWRAWERGNYPETWSKHHLRALPLRLGAYGDPTAIPFEVIKRLVCLSPGWTGYTHQWRQLKFRQFQHYCMASVQSIREELEASSRGWRCFRVKTESDIKVPFIESGCPASKEMGMILTCAQCLACSGLEGKGMGHKVINVHGTIATQRKALESVT